MAAITTLDTFGGSSDPITTGDGWTIFSGTGFQELSGAAVPKDYATTQGMVWSTGFTEDSTNWTTGTIAKVIFEGGFEAGAVYRLVYDYVDANNYRYVKILFGGVATFTDLNDDAVQLWKVVSGTHSQVTPDTASRNLQSEPGHLRHYQLANRSTTFYPSVSILTARHQHLVLVSAKDRIHTWDKQDWVILRATDTRTTTSGKVGIESVGGSHTINVRSMQAQLITLKWTAKTGSDSSTTGSYTAPYLTLGKLHTNVGPNQVGFVLAGTYRESLSNITAGSSTVITLQDGTSWEDAMQIHPYSTDSVLWESANSLACLYVKGTEKYYQCTVSMDGRLVAENCVKLWAQAAGNTGSVPKYFRLYDCRVKRAKGGANILVNQGTFYTGVSPFNVSPASTDYDQYHEFFDLESDGGNSSGAVPQGTHGLYLEPGSILSEYCYVHDNEGDGGKNFYGTYTGVNNVQVTNNNITRFNRCKSNGHYGWLVASGTNNILDHNRAWLNGTTDGSGLTIFNGCGTTYVRNNEAWQNGKLGTIHGNINVEHRSGNLAGPVYLDSNTSADGLVYGIAVYKDSGGTLGNVHITNCVDVDSGTEDFFTSVGVTLATNANNHETSGGDPLFNGQAGGDFSLQSDSSPLCEAGSAQAWTLAWDITRRPRPQDTGANAYDIGANEYPEPASNAPVITIGTSYAVTAGVAGAISDGVVVDPDGDALTLDGLFDNVTTTVSATGSGTGVLVTRS